MRNWFKLLWNCSKCALKLLWKYTGNQLEDYFQIAIKIVLKLLWNCSENRFGRELGSALKLLRNCSETDFELLWNGCAIVLKINLQIHLTWLRNCSETALKPTMQTVDGAAAPKRPTAAEIVPKRPQKITISWENQAESNSKVINNNQRPVIGCCSPKTP